MNNTQVIQKEGKFSKNKKSEQSRTLVIADALLIGVHLRSSVEGWLSLFIGRTDRIKGVRDWPMGA
jgi:hypothetical protein